MKGLLLIWCALSVVVTLGGCTKLATGVITGALGGGPNVAANVQAGKTNAQTVGQASFSDMRMVRPQARTIEQSTGATDLRADSVQRVVVNKGAPPWLILLALALWALPTPAAIGRTIWATIFNRKKGVA